MTWQLCWSAAAGARRSVPRRACCAAAAASGNGTSGYASASAASLLSRLPILPVDQTPRLLPPAATVQFQRGVARHARSGPVKVSVRVEAIHRSRAGYRAPPHPPPSPPLWQMSTRQRQAAAGAQPASPAVPGMQQLPDELLTVILGKLDARNRCGWCCEIESVWTSSVNACPFPNACLP